MTHGLAFGAIIQHLLPDEFGEGDYKLRKVVVLTPREVGINKGVVACCVCTSRVSDPGAVRLPMPWQQGGHRATTFDRPT